MMHPMSRARVCWDLLMLLFVVYVCLTIPFYLGFRTVATGGLKIFEDVVDYLFVLDLLINFRTGYLETSGAVVMAPNRVAAHYLKSWFLLDFVSSVGPFLGIIIRGAANLNAAKLLKIGRLLKAAKMLRVGKVFKVSQDSGAMDAFEEFMVSSHANAAGNVLAVIAACALICHLMACFMALSGPGYLRNYRVDCSFIGDEGDCSSAKDWPVRRQHVSPRGDLP